MVADEDAADVLAMTAHYANPANAFRVRELLLQADLTEQAAARELEIDEGAVRRYCAGQEPVPRLVLLALERLVGMRRIVTG